LRIEAGRMVFGSALREAIIVKGSAYKVVKVLLLSGLEGMGVKSRGSLPGATGLSISSLIDPATGRHLVQYARGWIPGGGVRVRALRLEGYYRFTISWAGPEAREAAMMLKEAALRSKIADVWLEEAVMEVVEPEPLREARVRLITPAQIVARRAFDKERLVVSAPTPSRLLRSALKTLSTEPGWLYQASALIDYYTVQAGGSFRQVTVILDEDKPSNWAIIGEARLAPVKGIPDNAAKLLSVLVKLTEYTGVGKSRKEGLGQATTEANP
jgi:hypothetical protein